MILNFLFICFYPAYTQKKWQKESLKTIPAICYASEETGHSFILPPEGFLKRLKSGTKTSNIIIQYVNTPDSVKPAIEYATEIWEYLLSSSIPIYLKVSWEALGTNILGNCSVGSNYLNFDGAPFRDIYYPVAIVEKIMEKELTGSTNPDIIAKFNSTISWYPGIDGNTPNTKYDLVSTVLHEIGHGLGINGFFRVNTAPKTAYYDQYNDNLPTVFDRYIENYNGLKLTNTSVFSNPSGDLYMAITSNQLYSGSPIAYTWAFETRPRLYAPAIYLAGSSIYHLNDLSYPYGNVNSLMTSSTGKGEAIHSPGPMTSGILADIGWKQLYIKYQPIKDIEDVKEPVEFKISVRSDLGIMNKSVILHYSVDNFKTNKDSVYFKKADTTDYFSAVIIPGITTGKISYYISAKDTAGRNFTSPLYYPDSLYTLNIGPDHIKPVISHHPVKFVLSSSKTFDIDATVTDNIGVESVSVVFTKNSTEEIPFNLIQGENNTYSGRFNFKVLGLDSVDSVRYSLIAIDLANAKNISRMPLKGTYSFKQEEIKNPVTEYSTDFETMQKDFVLSDFTISKESGFDNYSLNSPHPYPSPDKDYDSLEFTTVLRYPVILNKNGGMSFDEVVLVEPGEVGAVFGNTEFWDYVIIEGSKDGGNNWLPFLDGYDSGNQTSWETAYNNKISGNNSTTSGSKDLYVNHKINLTENGSFKAGDTVLVRFRLYSDAWAHGWGWAIDNLNIQNKTISGAIADFSPGSVTLWPNPVENQLNLLINHDKIIRQLETEIIDLTGRVLHRDFQNNVLPGQITTIDIGKILPGLFFITVKIDNRLIMTRKIIKSDYK